MGCGKGIVVSYLRQHGFDCNGVELADVQPLEAITRYVITKCSAEALPTDLRNQVVTILLLDVIEHLPDPQTFISQLVLSFPHLQHLLITVPACQELFSNYDEFNGHFRRYNLQMLQELAAATNMQLSTCRYFFHSLYLPARLLLRLSGKRKLCMKPPRGLKTPLHILLANILWTEFKLLPCKMKGTSALAVLKIKL